MMNMQAEMQFDTRLQEKKAYLNSRREKAIRYASNKGFLATIKVIVVIVYFCITPYLLAPNWCVEYNKNIPKS